MEKILWFAFGIKLAVCFYEPHVYNYITAGIIFAAIPLQWRAR